MWRVWCRVSGGVTGTRESYLKSDGKLAEFPTFEEANARAEELNKSMNHEYSRAFFSYTAVEA